MQWQNLTTEDTEDYLYLLPCLMMISTCCSRLPFPSMDSMEILRPETHFARGIGWKYLGTITFVFGDATAISCKKDCKASSAGC